MFKVNNVTMPEPSEISVSINDLDVDSTRNAKGDLIRDRVAVKRKYEIAYKSLSADDLSKILNAMKDEFFDATLIDPMENKAVTRKYYVGDRSIGVYSYNSKYKKCMYKDVKFSIVQK